MFSIFASTSIWTPRAWPGFGSHSEYGNDEPTISSVSHSFIRVHDGFVPSRPIAPVTNGRSSGTAALPSSAFATPAPSVSATSITSSVACSAPWPTSIATLSPLLRISAAADLARPLGVCTRHERGHLLVSDLHELDVLLALQRTDNRVDAVSGVAVDPADAVLGESFEYEIGGRLGHLNRTPIFRSFYDEFVAAGPGRETSRHGPPPGP